jgi:hypothetical protein
MKYYYNRVVHTFTSMSPFETCFRYLPHFPLDVVCGRGVSEDIIGEALKDEIFFDNIKQIHLQVHDTFIDATRHDIGFLPCLFSFTSVIAKFLSLVDPNTKLNFSNDIYYNVMQISTI